MYELMDVYRQLLLIKKNNFDIYLKREIFSYIKDDYKKIINNYYLGIKISKFIFSTSDNIFNFNKEKNTLFTFHKSEIPYPDLITFNYLKNYFNRKFHKNNMKYCFSHYCCSNKGICYKLDNYSNKLELIIN
jgi:hypothetical protein